MSDEERGEDSAARPRDATVELASAVALMIVVSFVILVTSLEVGETSRTAWIVLGVTWAITFLIRPRLSRWLAVGNAEFSWRATASALPAVALLGGSAVAAADAAGLADHGSCARWTFMLFGILVTMMLDSVRRPAFRWPEAPDDV